MRRSRSRCWRVGSFGLYQVAGRQWRVQPTFHVRARFASISGVEAGHRVRIQGIDAGVVEKVVPPGEPGGQVELVLRIDERLRRLVRRTLSRGSCRKVWSGPSWSS